VVFGLAAAREGLDDDHAAAAAATWTRQHAEFVGGCGRGRFGLWLEIACPPPSVGFFDTSRLWLAKVNVLISLDSKRGCSKSRKRFSKGSVKFSDKFARIFGGSINPSYWGHSRIYPLRHLARILREL
jgi:hypothetical protein